MLNQLLRKLPSHLKPRHYAGQAALYLVSGLLIAYLSDHPTYTRMEPNTSLLKLSLTHPGDKADPCHERTKEELAKLPPNMRSKMECSRRRVPVMLELDLDGKKIYSQSSEPAGLSKDGASRFYARFVIPSGPHKLTARMRDGVEDRFNYEASADVMLESGHILVVDYAGDKRDFIFLSTSDAKP
jgi:hypothetical protein